MNKILILFLLALSFGSQAQNAALAALDPSEDRIFDQVDRVDPQPQTAYVAVPEQTLVRANVSSVFDGDGCRVRFEPKGTTTEIRFRYIDAPECRGYSIKAQPYGNVSRDSLRAWIKGKDVLLDTSKVDGKSRDVYGRLLATAYFVSDTSSVSFRIVDAGLAWYVPTRYGDRNAKRLLNTAMQDATANKRGLWLSYLLPDGKTARILTPATWRKRWRFKA